MERRDDGDRTRRTFVAPARPPARRRADVDRVGIAAAQELEQRPMDFGTGNDWGGDDASNSGGVIASNSGGSDDW